jgi:superfamily II DNA/RNA helicase
LLISSTADKYVKEDEAEENTDDNHYRYKRQRRNEVQEEIKFQSSQTFHLPLQKLLFSATLTDNPTALALLGITLPINIHCKELYARDHDSHRKNKNPDNLDETSLLIADASTQEEDYFQEEIFDLPELLSERVLIVETRNRLLKLLGVLLLSFHSFGEELRSQWDALKKEGMTYDFMHSCSEEKSVCIIFVNSVDASHRLSLFLKLLNNQILNDLDEDDDETIPAATRSQLRQLREDLIDHFQLTQIIKQQQQQQREQEGGNYLFKGRVEEMTRLIKPQEREQILSAALTGQVSIIVCSDRMARGMDLPQLKLVINYDLPKSAKTYIHRAGRTARAGRSGICLSLVKKGQVQELNLIRDQIRRTGRPEEQEADAGEVVVKDEKTEGRRKRRGGKQHVLDYFQLCYMSKAYLDAITPYYEQSIQVLPALLSRETGGK